MSRRRSKKNEQLSNRPSGSDVNHPGIPRTTLLCCISVPGGLPLPKDRSLVFVAGSSDPTLDYDDPIAVEATEAGTYKYVTVQGADKTVAAYDFLSTRTALPPLDAFKQR